MAGEIEKGFSFLELLIAVFLVAGLLLTVVGIELQVESQDDRVEIQGRALALARDRLESLMATDYDDLTAGNDVVDLPGSRSLARSWDVVRNAPRPGMTTVSVTVRERNGDGDGFSSAPPVRLTAALVKE